MSEKCLGLVNAARVKHPSHLLYLVEIDGLPGILAILLRGPQWQDSVGSLPVNSAAALLAMGQNLSENPVLADWLPQSWMVDPDRMQT